jgi:Kef-type K+ transport system membrane component KefB
MPDVSFTNLLMVAAVAVLAPLTVGFFPQLRVPAVVLEIIGGIIIGPAVLGWVHVDLPVQILALFGLRHPDDAGYRALADAAGLVLFRR